MNIFLKLFLLSKLNELFFYAISFCWSVAVMFDYSRNSFFIILMLLYEMLRERHARLLSHLLFFSVKHRNIRVNNLEYTQQWDREWEIYSYISQSLAWDEHCQPQLDFELGSLLPLPLLIIISSFHIWLITFLFFSLLKSLDQLRYFV